MSKRVTILANLVGLISILVGASCSSVQSPTSVLTIDPVSSPPIINSTDTPLPAPTSTSTKTSLLPCAWTAYFYDGESVTSPSNENCLKVSKGIRISEDLNQLSFFVNRSSALGTYGVCRNISEEDDIKFNVAINDSMVSARFLLMVSPVPVPTKKLSFGLRIQPHIVGKNEKSMWVKWIEYASDDFENDKGGLEAIPDWKKNDVWNFDFTFQFSGSQAVMSMNKKALSRVWPLSSSTRYLCFAYQQTPTADNATELEIQVNFQQTSK